MSAVLAAISVFALLCIALPISLYRSSTRGAAAESKDRAHVELRTKWKDARRTLLGPDPQAGKTGSAAGRVFVLRPRWRGRDVLLQVWMALCLGAMATIVLAMAGPSAFDLAGGMYVVGLGVLFLALAATIAAQFHPGSVRLAFDHSGFVLRLLWRERRYAWSEVLEAKAIDARYDRTGGHPDGVQVTLRPTPNKHRNRRIFIPDRFSLGRHDLAAIIENLAEPVG